MAGKRKATFTLVENPISGPSYGAETAARKLPTDDHNQTTEVLDVIVHNGRSGCKPKCKIGSGEIVAYYFFKAKDDGDLTGG